MSVKKTILVIDDMAAILEHARQLLKEKYSVIPCLSAEQAYEILERRIPDIILVDILGGFIKIMLELVVLVVQQVLEINGSDTDCLSVCMLELLVHLKHGSPEDYLPILDIIINDPASTLTRIESAFDLKEQCLKWLNDEQKKNESFLNQALYYETKAKSIIKETVLQNSDYATLSRIEDLLKKAIKIYRNFKRKEQAKEAELKKMAEQPVPYLKHHLAYYLTVA